MPYIELEQRKPLDRWLALLQAPETEGELNYLITRLLLKTSPQSYRDFNTLIGVLECIKLEFYRRVLVPYEDEKREENREVYH